MHLPSLALRVFVLAAISAAASACEQNMDCDGKFCGTDGECHNLSCAEWYQYQYGGAASQDPNLDESNTETLTCKDIDNTWPGSFGEASITYRCNTTELAPGIARTGFNRKCTAGGPTFEYTCYELSEGTQFLTFMSKVESLQNLGRKCNDGKDFHFSYHIIKLNCRKENGCSMKYSKVFKETAELDKVRATTGTLYSIYKNTAPTFTPTSSSHNPIAASKNWFTMFVAVSLQCSAMYSFLF